MNEDGLIGRQTQDAANPKEGITLDELYEFVVEARKKRIVGSTRVLMWANWKQSAKRVRVEGYLAKDE